jgi:hypothetical protein
VEELLKRDPVTRFSTSGFFHQTTPILPLTHGLKPFCIWLRIRRDIRLWNQFFVASGVNDTADQGGRSGTFWLDSDPHSEKSGAGSGLNLTLSHSGTADQWWAVSMMPLTLAVWCQWHCGFNYAIFVPKLSGVNDTADQWWAVPMTPLTKIDTADQGTSKFSMLLLLLKGFPIEKSYIGKLY